MMRKWISGEIFTFRFLNGVIQLIYDVIKFVYDVIKFVNDVVFSRFNFFLFKIRIL